MKSITKGQERRFLKEFWSNVDYYRKITNNSWTYLSHNNVLGAKNGTRSINLVTAYDIANKLDVSIQDLMEVDYTMPLETAYKLVCNDLKINKDDLLRLIDKKQLADDFIKKWREN